MEFFRILFIKCFERPYLSGVIQYQCKSVMYSFSFYFLHWIRLFLFPRVFRNNWLIGVSCFVWYYEFMFVARNDTYRNWKHISTTECMAKIEWVQRSIWLLKGMTNSFSFEWKRNLNNEMKSFSFIKNEYSWQLWTKD